MDAWRKVMGSAAATVDRAMTFAIHVRSARDRARTKTMSHAERLDALVEIERIYGDASLLPLPSPFFPDPKAADMTLRHVREGAWDASWPSPFEPFFEGVASGYLANVANRTAHALSAKRSGAIRLRSWCRATALSARTISSSASAPTAASKQS